MKKKKKKKQWQQKASVGRGGAELTEEAARHRSQENLVSERAAPERSGGGRRSRSYDGVDAEMLKVSGGRGGRTDRMAAGRTSGPSAGRPSRRWTEPEGGKRPGWDTKSQQGCKREEVSSLGDELDVHDGDEKKKTHLLP